MKNAALPRLMIASLVVLWLCSGVVSLWPSAAISQDLLAALGVPPTWRWPMLWTAALWDVLLGLALCTPLARRVALWWAQAVTVLVYSLIVLLFLPDFLFHPFAPLVKNLPVLALIAACAQHACFPASSSE